MTTDTPETDAAEWSAENIPPNVSPDFARRLERERDHWKSECKRMFLSLTQCRHNAIKIQNLRFGYDGGCGVEAIAEQIEEDCNGFLESKAVDAWSAFVAAEAAKVAKTGILPDYIIQPQFDTAPKSDTARH